MSERTVTMIVTPGERFGMARESLLSLFGATGARFDLIYVDCGADPMFSDWLDEQAGRRGFRILRPGLVTPNQARNLAIKLATGRFIAFLENDVLVTPGWLDALIECAQQQQADIVAPLVCAGLPAHGTVLHAGLRLSQAPMQFFAQPHGQRRIAAEPLLAGQPLVEVAAQLSRAVIDACAWHCLLVRRSLFDWIGPLDEQLLAGNEHLDLALAVAQAGRRIVLEPQAIVTHVAPCRQRPLSRADWQYLLLRSSPQWRASSARHLQAKWGLRADPGDPAEGAAMTRARVPTRIDWLIEALLASIPGASRSPAWRGLCRRALESGCLLAGEWLTRMHRHRQSRRSAGAAGT